MPESVFERVDIEPWKTRVRVLREATSKAELVQALTSGDLMLERTAAARAICYLKGGDIPPEILELCDEEVLDVLRFLRREETDRP